MHKKMLRRDRGVVLIVVVGVLAVLSLLAATFGMIARLELAVSRNQTEYEMAREAAHAGSEYLLSALQSWLNGSTMTSGAVPDFLPNTADTDGQLLYRRDGVKVYMAVSPTVQTGSVKPDWLQGLGLQDAGMFNINAMGFANDLGSNCNPDIRYTSFDCSLVRLLASRFATVSATDITNANGTGIDDIRLASGGKAVFFNKTLSAGYPSFAASDEQLRMAILLSRAIINWRHGPDGVPGAAGTEERRLGHLPRWNSKLGWTSADDVGSATAYPPSGPLFPNYSWGWHDHPSLFINATGILGPTPWSYPEPGVWSSYLGNANWSTDIALPMPGVYWGNDVGLPVPGLFWGKMTSGSTTATVCADTTQPGWRDWPAHIWQGDYIYIATGPYKWTWQIISDNTSSSLSFATALAPPTSTLPQPATGPNPGDAFCICPSVPFPWSGSVVYQVGNMVSCNDITYICIKANSGSVPPNANWQVAAYNPGLSVGVLSKRWDNATSGVGDLVPNAMFWPDTDSTLATEGNVWDLRADNNSLLAAGNYGQVANMGAFTQSVTDTDASLYDTTKNWNPDACKGYVVHIYAGTGRGQVRTITGNTAAQLTLATPWTNGNLPDVTSMYRIEHSDDNLPSKFQPNNLQGDDRLYLSLGDLRDSVIVPALVNDGLTTAYAQATADILLPYFLPYLSVSTQAIQASQSLCSINDWAVDGVDNDANGVVDDNATSAEPLYEQQGSVQGNANRAALAKILYNKLGLSAWAHAGATVVTTTRVQQAAQLVANIIDFRDPTDVPTKLTISNLDPAAPSSIANAVVYGAKGLHVTQVMPSPDAIYSINVTNPLAVNEMTNDGGTGTQPGLHDMAAWDWRDPNNWQPGPPINPRQSPPGPPNNACWQLMPNTVNPATTAATFTFTNLMPGFYALRLIGGQNNVFKLSWTDALGHQNPSPGNGPTPDTYTATMSLLDPDTNYSGWYTGFVRHANGTLVCFDLSTTSAYTAPGTLTFKLSSPSPAPTPTSGPQFRGFALCAQYIQLTNIATHDIRLDGMTVTTDQGLLLGSSSSAQPWQLNYTRADGGLVDLRRIPGAAVGTPGILSTKAAATATYPINYGTYVICMCEEAYEKQWSAQKGNPDPDYVATNGDGIWGNALNEAYPIYPYGDINGKLSGAVTGDQQTMALLMATRGTAKQYAPSVTVQDAAGDLIAGGPAADGTYVDGKIPIMNVPTHPDATRQNELSCYSAIEKTVILQPTWDTSTSPGYWAPFLTAVAGTIPTSSTPAALAASQNTLVVAQDDAPRVPGGASVSFRACLNKNYGWSTTANAFTAVWDHAAMPSVYGSGVPLAFPPAAPVWYTDKRWASLATPSYMASRNQVFPFILNRPYATTAWLGLVPTSNTDAINALSASLNVPAFPTVLGSWRTIDPNPTPSVFNSGNILQPNPPTCPEQLLGTLMSNATVGGVYARFNINTAPLDTLKSVFPDTQAAAIVAERQLRQWPAGQPPLSQPQPTWWGAAPWTAGTLTALGTPGASPPLAAQAWASWDELLNDPLFQYSYTPYAPNPGGIGFYDSPGPLDPVTSGISNADAGAGTYADGFPDSSNEKKEWFMRYANLFCLQSTSFQFTVAGLVYKDQSWDSTSMQNNEPVALVRIEVNVDLSNQSGPSIVHFRYLTQQ